MDSRNIAETTAVTRTLAQVTSGWKPAPGVTTDALSAAQKALATSLLRGVDVSGMVAGRRLMVAEPTDPRELVELQSLVEDLVGAGESATIAAVRTTLAASPANPLGRPVWARGAKLVATLGPFVDAGGAQHWVELFHYTVSMQFAFGSPATPFGVLPIVEFLLPPPNPSKLTLGAGSIWFLAQWLSAAFPAGEFTGFSITGGTLSSSVPFHLQGGIYVIPVGATVTVDATLASVPAMSPGMLTDADEAVFAPPSTVTIAFTQGKIGFGAIAAASVDAYGSTAGLSWAGLGAVAVAGLPLVLIPTDASVTNFDFANVISPTFAPSGSAALVQAGWALPLANTAIGSLPTAAGPGVCLLRLGDGASLMTEALLVPTPVKTWVLEVSTGLLSVSAGGKGATSKTVFALWRERLPANRQAAVEFSLAQDFVVTCVASVTQELVLSTGQVVTFVDRPVSAAGTKISFSGTALLIYDRSATGTGVGLIGERPISKSVFSIALENALLGVRQPPLFTFGGSLEAATVTQCVAAFYFELPWILPILPDPYAANFDFSILPGESDNTSLGTVVALTAWGGGALEPVVSFTLLPKNTSSGAAIGAVFGEHQGRVSQVLGGLALLDLSTRIDLFGVAFVGSNYRRLGGDFERAPNAKPAPALGLAGMSFLLNGGSIAMFALPQSSWEPMESTATDEFGPLYCEPASDGYPLVLSAPNTQQLVPMTAEAVLLNNIDNVAAGDPFWAVFSLPFGLNAFIQQPNRRLIWKAPQIGRADENALYRRGFRSTFLAAGGQFRLNEPHFQQVIPPSPPMAVVGGSSAKVPPPLSGAIQLTLVPPHPEKSDAMFSGYTETESVKGPSPGYGAHVLSYQGVASVTDIFNNAFGPGGATPGVPLRRIDFSGYGASIYSEWSDPDAIPPNITKVQFETSIGRTGYEVIQAITMVYPYCVQLVRTITMQRQNAGWVKRADTGWQPSSPGVFKFPVDVAAKYVGRLHTGAMVGVFNVRNLREQSEVLTSGAFTFKKILFDADIGVDPTLKVVSGSFTGTVVGYPGTLTLLPSTNLVGYTQLSPDGMSPDENVLSDLVRQSGPLTPAIACTVEVGSFAGHTGTSLRASAFEVNMIHNANDGSPLPALGVALRGAPQIPRGGGWSMGRRGFNEPAPSALPNDFPVPLVQPATNAKEWFIADVADVLQVTQPNNFYSLLHSTGTHKILFEQPQIPTALAGVAVPGLQFPKPNPPAPPKPGAVPVNAGSPNLGDFASILNSTGLFPDLNSVLSLLQGSMEQINTISQGFHYLKSFPFDPTQQVLLIDVGVLNIVLQYADTTIPAPNPLTPTTLTYTVDSSASPSWMLKIAPLSFLVNIPVFGSGPVLTITGGFYADEHTAPGLTDLNVQIGDALSVVKNIFSKLQTLAQFLPGGAGANLDVALSDGKLTVSDSFTIGDLPLGLGNLTDISLNLGLAVQLQPLSVDFAVGIGSPRNPFNWIVSPLAGNGLMNFGVTNNAPSLVIQAGIGLGLAIDLGIASGSASVTIAVQLDINGSGITLMAILSGQASVDVLDGLASASLTLSAGLGFGLNPAVPLPMFSPPFPGIPTSVTLPSVEITMIATCSVGIHLTVCWVVSVGWDGSWTFSQSVDTPALTVSI